LEHKKEVDKIAFEDEDPETGFVILPDMKWDGKTLSALVSGLKQIRQYSAGAN